MHVKLRLPHLTGVLLLAATPFAGAEAPLPDPVAPAVVGRPLDQIRPARAARQQAAAATPVRPKHVAAAKQASRARPAAAAVSAAAVQPPAAPPLVAKEAAAPGAVPRTDVAGNVGTRFAAAPPALGAYFTARDQALVRRYYDEARPGSGQVARWKIGEPIPPGTALAGVPDGLRAALPALPPGHQYVQLDGEVALVAVPTRRVVDGISRGAR